MYYIIEHQSRPDGVVNASEVARQSKESAQSYFFERLSKMCMTDMYTSVSIMLVDEHLNVIERRTIATMYDPNKEAT